MKTIFAKYNRERVPCFQTVTKIIEENGIRKAIKQPISVLAKPHIENINNNYRLLLENYPHIKLCKPTIRDDGIEFEMVGGESLEILLKRELDCQNKEGFFNLIEKYIRYLDSFVVEKNTQFIPCEQFSNIFGEWTINTSQDVLKVADVDLIFSNVFIDEESITQIDYEWVFNFPVPKYFIIWRAVITFFLYHGAEYSGLLNASEVLSVFGIDASYNELFIKMDRCFQKMVHGSEFNFFLNKEYLQPRIDIFEQLRVKNNEILIKNEELILRSQEFIAKNHELKRKNLEYNRLVNSLSWKITKPLRFAKRKLKQIALKIKNRAFRQKIVQCITHSTSSIIPTGYSEIRQYVLSACDLHENNLKTLYVFPVIDWDYRFQRPQHLARGFAKQDYKVFYFTTSFNISRKPGYTIRSIENNVFEVKLNYYENINIYTQVMTPAVQDFLLKSIAKFEADLGIINKIVKLDHPFWVDIATLLNGTVIYDCMDDHEGFNDGLEHILVLEKKAIEVCDILIVSSDKLYEKFAPGHNYCVLIENACDYNFFAQVKYLDEVNELKKQLSNKPVIGYFGAIANWFDLECLEYLVDKYPDYQFVLIGNTHGCEEISNLKEHKNVYLLGEKPYISLPAYLDLFDICLIPFKIIPLTLATNPVKMFEYLSQGKPVVSTGLPEVLKYSNVVYTALNKFEFAKKIELALTEKDKPELINARIEVAKNNSWNNRFLQLAAFINTYQPLEPKVSVIVLTYNNLNLTKNCLYSLYKYSNYQNLEIIVVDNMSSDGSREWLTDYVKEKHNFKLILNESNVGFSAGNNIGIRHATGDYIIILNNDTFVSAHWVKILLKYFSKSDIGMVGPVTNNIGNQAKITLPNYFTEPDFIRLATLNYYNNYNKIYEMKDGSLAFFCAAIKREVIDKVGLLDENFGRGWFEDDDYNLRVRQAGYRTVIVDDVLIHHEHSASFGKLDNNARTVLFNKNKAYFEQKHLISWIPHVGTRS